ncbi:hypothetical protein L596_022304 [Steinernema carpocapsae]|uniref:Uncharacterized protein n=1 Tax=Steinernema carpocapsae TaxID=34508 RepID=A0A4U5MLA3_STECR|nr:hypothetical protein L596_022304 [Steinernema carpocapsae]
MTKPCPRRCSDMCSKQGKNDREYAKKNYSRAQKDTEITKGIYWCQAHRGIIWVRELNPLGRSNSFHRC